MSKKKDPAEYVTVQLCQERSTRIFERIDAMDTNLSDRLTKLEKKFDEAANNTQAEKTEESHARRNAALTFLSGAGIALLTWVLANIHW